MADKRPKESRKRQHGASDFPSKWRRIEAPTGQTCALQSSRVVLYTPSSELLNCLGLFLCQRCYKLKHLSPEQPVTWIRQIDNFLRSRRRVSFLSSGSVVFLYMMCRDLISPEVDSMEELQAALFTSLYISYSYIGHGLSYPMLPFMVGNSKTAFWERCLSYIRIMSTKMMWINVDHQLYSRTLAELRDIGRDDKIQYGEGMDCLLGKGSSFKEV